MPFRRHPRPRHRRLAPGTPTFADKASLQTAVTEYDSNAAAATAKYGAIAGWCVSGVTDMSYLFYNMGNFKRVIENVESKTQDEQMSNGLSN